jgi:transposase
MEWVALVGLDWGDQQHAYVVVGADGSGKSGSVKSRPEDVHEWVRIIRERYPSGNIVVALEAGCTSLLQALAEYDFLIIVPINPLASKSYRKSLRLSGASSDPIDAELICEFARKHLSSLRAWSPDDAETRKLRLLAEQRRTLVDQRTAVSHALSAALKMFFPQALQWFGGEKSRLLRAFLMAWPTLDELRTASLDQLVSLFKANRCRKVNDKAQTLVEQTHPEREIFESLPGAGPTLGPRLAAAFGTDRSRYHDASEIQCYSGIAPVVEQSGRTLLIHARWAYPAFLHQTFHEFAQASIPHSAWAKAVYDEQRSRGAAHHAAIRALAFRWIRIIFRLWQNEDLYDEQRHIDRLRQKGSSIAARIAA